MFVVEGETSRSHEIDEKGLHEELGSSDRSGKPDKLSENIRVKHAHDGTGQLVEQNSSSTHTVKEQFAPEENREIASFNADNEFNRAINEENIDFNIPGLPHSAVKRSHGHPQRRALQSDLQQHRPFSPFSKESRDVIEEAGNTELCELLDVEPKAQCKVCLSYWDVGVDHCTCGHFLRDDTTENKKYIKSVKSAAAILSWFSGEIQMFSQSHGTQIQPSNNDGDFGHSVSKSIIVFLQKFHVLGHCILQIFLLRILVQSDVKGF